MNTAALRQKYAADASIDVDDIVEVDAVWGDHTLAQALGGRAPVDYAVASHVIEHVPDMLAWLEELHAVIKPGGDLRLAGLTGISPSIFSGVKRASPTS